MIQKGMIQKGMILDGLAGETVLLLAWWAFRVLLMGESRCACGVGG